MAYVEGRLENGLATNWWALVLRGLLAIAFGVMTFFWPAIAWLAVVCTFAAYALVDGSMAIVSAVRGHGAGGPWWALLLQGIVGIAAGLLAIVWPGMTALAMLYLIAGWSIVTGALQIAAAIRLRRHIEGEWLLALGGVLSIILGLALGLMPIAGLLVVAWWIGAYALVFGVLMTVLGFQLRSLVHHPSRLEPVGAP